MGSKKATSNDTHNTLDETRAITGINKDNKESKGEHASVLQPQASVPQPSARATQPQASAPQPPDGLANLPTIDGVGVLGTNNASSEDAPLDDTALEEQLALQTLQARRRKAKRKRAIKLGIVGGIIALALVGWGVSHFSGSSEGGPELPPTATVTRGEFSSAVTTSGTTNPKSSTVVTPEVDGIIEDVRISEGSTVSEGDVLFSLKNDTLDRQVREAEQQVRVAKNQVASAQTSVDTAYASYERALDKWNAAKTAEEQEVMEDPDVVYSQVLSAQDSLDGANISLESARQAYNDAVANAAKRTVVAPISGSVVAMNAVEGAAVGGAAGATQTQSSSGPLVQIADLSQMTIATQVNEIDITSLAVGQTATVTFSALPDVSLEAKVVRIATVAKGTSSEMGGPQGVVSYDVELLIENPDPALKPGMTASVKIFSTRIENALMVPLEALSESVGDDGKTVHTVEVVSLDEKGMIASSQTKQVSVVASDATTAVIEGLSEGETVLLTMQDDGSDSSMPAEG